MDFIVPLHSDDFIYTREDSKLGIVLHQADGQHKQIRVLPRNRWVARTHSTTSPCRKHVRVENAAAILDNAPNAALWGPTTTMRITTTIARLPQTPKGEVKYIFHSRHSIAVSEEQSAPDAIPMPVARSC